MSYQRHTQYHPLLAGYDIHGKPWVHPELSKRMGQSFADNILKHETVFLEEVRKPRVSWSEAREKALKAEHEGISQEEISVYRAS